MENIVNFKVENKLVKGFILEQEKSGETSVIYTVGCEYEGKLCIAEFEAIPEGDKFQDDWTSLNRILSWGFAAFHGSVCTEKNKRLVIEALGIKQ